MSEPTSDSKTPLPVLNAAALVKGGSVRRFGSILIQFAALSAVVIGVAACGGASSPGVASMGSTTTTVASSPAGTTGNSGSVTASQLKFAKCMQSHGEPDYPEPGGSAEANAKAILKLDPRSPQFVAAQKACQKDLRKEESAPPSEQAKVEGESLKFARCMQTHGMPNWPDPNSNGVGYMVAPAGAEASSPAYLKAARACKALLPSG